MGLNDLLRDIETVAGRMDVDPYRIFSMASFRKEPLHVFRRDAHPTVFNTKSEFSTCSHKANLYPPSRRRVSDRIVYEVPYRMLFQFVFISRDREHSFVRRKIQRELPFNCRR